MANGRPGTARYVVGFAFIMLFVVPFYDFQDLITPGLSNFTAAFSLFFMVALVTYLVHGMLRLYGNSTRRSSTIFFLILLLESFPPWEYGVVSASSPAEQAVIDFISILFFSAILYAFTKRDHGMKYGGLFLFISLQLFLMEVLMSAFPSAIPNGQFDPTQFSLVLLFLGFFFLIFAWVVSWRQLKAIRRIGSGSNQKYGNNSSYSGSGGTYENTDIPPPPSAEESDMQGAGPEPVPPGQPTSGFQAQTTVSPQPTPAATPHVQYEKGSNTAAVIGYTGGGKTTLITLFVYAAGFINEIPGYSFTLESVSPVLRDSIKSMLSGEWPEGTYVGELRTETNITISRKSGLRTKKVDLRLNDASGETWTKLAEEGETPQALRNLLASLPQVAYLPWTSQYIVTIDSENYQDWATEQFYYLNIFKSLYYLNGKKKVRKPVLLVFTKFDRLPEVAKNTPLPTLLKRDLSHIYQYLNQHFTMDDVRLYRIGIEVTADNKPQVNLVNGRKSLTIVGSSGPYGQIPDIVKSMLEV